MANECPKCQTDNPDTVKFCGGIADRIIVKLLKLRAWKVVNWP
jgi:hypothetical protein